MKATDKTNSNKDYMLRVRMDKNILKKLDDISSDKNKSRSETVRELIENEFEKNNQKEISDNFTDNIDFDCIIYPTSFLNEK